MIVKVCDKEINKSAILKTSVVLICALLFGRDIFALPINSHVVTLISVPAFLFLDYQLLVAFIMFLIPLISGVSAGELMLLAAISIVCKRKNNGFFQYIVIMVTIGLEVFASTYYPNINYAEMFQYFMITIVLFLLLLNYDCLDYKICVKYYFYGIICAVFVAIFGSLMSGGLDLSHLISYKFRSHIGTWVETVDGARLVFNANTYAYFCLSGVVCGLFLLNTSVKRKNKKYIFAFIGLLGICGMLSISRTYILVLVMVICLYSMTGKINIHKMLRFVVVFLCLFIGGYVAIKSNSSITSAFIDRFTGEDIETGGKRLILIREYLEAFRANPRFLWLGTGVVEYRTILNVFNSIHNATQQIIVCLGIPGSVLYLIALLLPVFKVIRHKVELVYWIPFLGIVVFLQSIQFLNPSMFMLTYVPAIYCLRYGARDVYQKDYNSKWE